MFCCATKPWERHLCQLSKEKLCKSVFSQFSRVLSALAHQLHTMVKLTVSAVNNLKMMGGGHAVHKWQAILSITAVIFHTFCTENENELTFRGAQQISRDAIMQVGHYKQRDQAPNNTECNYIVSSSIAHICMPSILSVCLQLRQLFNNNYHVT